MERSLLNRLPDIIALARHRARELAVAPPAPRTRPRPAWPVAKASTGPEDLRRVSLLCGDELTALSGLLSGRGRPADSMAGQVALVWFQDRPVVHADSLGTTVPLAQPRVRELIDLSTSLFLARPLLRDGGHVVVTAAANDPDRSIERLMTAVFDAVRPLGALGSPGNGSRRHLAGPGMDSDARSPEELIRSCTHDGDTVLVLQANIPCAHWVAGLDRNWILVQPQPLCFALLREHILAQQLGCERWRIVSEDRREWAGA